MSAPVASYSSQGHRWNLQSLYNGIEDPRLDSDFAESVAEADAFAAVIAGEANWNPAENTLGNLRVLGELRKAE